MDSFFAAWLCLSKVPASRAGWVLQAYLWFLPQVSLRTQLHRTILGGSKAPFPYGRACGDNRWNGEEGHPMPGWCPPPSYPVVSAACLFISDSNSPHFLFCSSSYANRSAHFISAYHARLSGSQAMWANKKYHSHRSLPLDIIAEVKHSVFSWILSKYECRPHWNTIFGPLI